MEPKDVKDFFDNSSETYREDRKSGTEYKVKIISESSASGDYLLDVGCGSGYFLEAIESETPVTAIGVDISRAMLSNQSGVVQGSVTDLPFQEESFDYIHIDTVLHHLVGDSRTESLENAQECLAALFQCLKKDGRLLLTEHIFESPIKPSIAPALIYYILSSASKPFSFLHPEIQEGLVASFFTRSQIRSLVSHSGGTVIDVSEQEIQPSKREKILLSHRSRYTIHAQK